MGFHTKRITLLIVCLVLTQFLLCDCRLAEDIALKRFFKHSKRFIGAPTRNPPADPLSDLPALIKTLMACPSYKIPGLAISVTVNGSVVFSNGFGLRDIASNLPVTPQTLFSVGSVSKAFTSTLAAMMVDAGKLDFDAPVTTYLPGFTLKDDFVGKYVCVKDMLSHRTGLSRNDYVWVAAVNLTIDQMVYSLRYLTLDLQFRSDFQYNNLMVAAGGHVVEVVSGQSFAELTESLIFSRLNMTSSTTDVYKMIASGNYATSYAMDENGNILSFEPDCNKNTLMVAPAAAVISSVSELSNWLQMHLNGGVWNGERLVSEASLAETHSPQMISNDATMAEPTYPAGLFLDTYGMGWWLGNYRGHPMQAHGGDVSGSSSHMFLFPLDNISVAVLSNMDSISDAYVPLALYIYDVLMGFPTWVNDDNICQEVPDVATRRSELRTPQMPNKTPKKRTSAGKIATGGKFTGRSSAEDFVGTYSHPVYGPLSVNANSSGLFFQWSAYYGPLTQQAVSGDVFTGACYSYSDVTPESWPFQFGRNWQGQVDSVSVMIPTTTPGPVTFTNTMYSVQDCPYPQFVPSV